MRLFISLAQTNQRPLKKKRSRNIISLHKEMNCGVVFLFLQRLEVKSSLKERDYANEHRALQHQDTCLCATVVAGALEHSLDM